MIELQRLYKATVRRLCIGPPRGIIFVVVGLAILFAAEGLLFASPETANLIRIEARNENQQGTVVISCTTPVQYRSEVLRNPDRVYFDFENTRPAAGLKPSLAPVPDALIRKIVVAEREPGVTRVVIHLGASVTYRVVASQNPIGVVISLQAVPATLAGSGTKAFGVTASPTARSGQMPVRAEPRGDKPEPTVRRRAMVADASPPISARSSAPTLPEPPPPIEDFIAVLKLADVGDADAQAALGYAHETGQLGADHFEQAIQWYTRAAAQRNAFAMIRLGDIYAGGLGTAKDLEQAERWYARAGWTRENINRRLLALSTSGAAPPRSTRPEHTKTESTSSTTSTAGHSVLQLPSTTNERAAPPTTASAVLPANLPIAAPSTRRTEIAPGLLAVSLEDLRTVSMTRRRSLPTLALVPDIPAPVRTATFKARPSSAPQIKFDPGLAPQDPRLAEQWYLKAARAGVVEAQFALANMYFSGRGMPKNLAAAARWYRAAAEQGHARAESNLGILYLNGWGIDKSVRSAVAWFGKSAEQGDATGQSNLGAAYVSGIGVLVDYAKGAEWLRKAAEQGIAEAQYGLATLYANGRGVPRDLTTAADWLRRAAALGFPKAQLLLGQMCMSGQVKGADGEGPRMIQTAASDGLPQAQIALGEMYRDGSGLAANGDLALKWLGKAAEARSAEAQFAMGEMYRDGKSVAKNPVMAYAWFAVAAANRHESGLKALNALSPTMTMAQISAGQQQAYALTMKLVQAKPTTTASVQH